MTFLTVVVVMIDSIFIQALGLIKLIRHLEMKVTP